MTSVIAILLAAVYGSVLAIVYFGGLWWTVRRLPAAEHPVALYFGSVAFRLAFAVVGFYLMIANCDLQTLVACLLGFIAMRLFLVRFLGRENSPAPAIARDHR